MPASTKTAKAPKTAQVPPVANTLFVSPGEAPPEQPAPVLEGAVVPPLAYDVANPPFPSWLGAQWELVTPQVAEAELERMHVNRSQSKINTDVMEANLRAARWYPDISVTFVDAEGLWWDCMHRLMAIKKTGLPAWILVVRGVREEAAECIDTGRPRTYKDWLRMNDVSWYAQRGTLARHLAVYAHYGIAGIRNPSQAAVANWQMDEWLYKPGTEESLKLADAIRRVKSLKKVNVSVLGYMVMLTGAGQDPTGFWQSVKDGEDLKKDMPAKTLREFLMGGGNFAVRTEPRLAQLYACTVAWNKHVKGESYPFVRPSYARRANGVDVYFPARNIPDALPLDFDAHAELARFAEMFRELRSAPGQQLALEGSAGPAGKG